MRIIPVCPPTPDPVPHYGVDTWNVIVQLRAVPDCPNLDATRDLLPACLAESGTAPHPADVAEAAARANVDPVAALQSLAEDDLVAVDDEGRLVAAYPFSPTPTDHVVQAGGVRVYAMCAIDALGIPAMLER